MDSITEETLKLAQEMAKTTPWILATAEEAAYFAAQPIDQKKPLQADIPRLLPAEKKSAPLPPALPEPAFQKIASSSEEEKVSPKKAAPRLPPDLRPAIQKALPELSLREKPLDDTMAKKLSRLWEESYLTAQVLIIAFGEVGPGMEFLKQVTGAIDKLLLPAQLIEGTLLEKERGWDLLLGSPLLKTVICSPWACWHTTSLTKYYRQNGSSGKHFLGHHPLLLLEPSLTYLKHPDRKRELWKTLSTHLSS
jgi:hypothetical protein